MVNVEEYRTLFIVGTLVSMLVAVVPAFSLFIRIPSGSERFSELWLLGPAHTAENYPFNVSVTEQYRLFVGVGNHLHSSSYYIVYVKFRNQTQQLPNSTMSEPSLLPPLYEYHFVLSNGEVWEAPLTFAIENVVVQQNFSLVQNISINGITFPINYSSSWNSDKNGFYYQMFFELWLYNTTS
ncbi:MAG: DUF1616 domain-containing protein, partial [Candidatus Bathyarchaeota archaeon]